MMGYLWDIVVKCHDCPMMFFDDGYRYCTHEDGPKYCQKEECPLKLDAYKFKRVSKKWHINHVTGDKKS
jgi:hypothetical protein